MLKTGLPAVTAGSLDQYIKAVQNIPSLSPGEEKGLAEKYQKTGCLDSARTLILSHLKYVVFIASTYKNYGLSQADLIQEGNIGLMKAVKGFNPSMGNRLVTYANHWVSAEITDFIVRNFRVLKIATTKAQRKLFFNLRKMKKSTSWMDDSEVRQLAEKLSVSPDDVRQMEGRLNFKDSSFNPLDVDNEEEPYAPENYLGSTKWSAETVAEQESLNRRNQLLLQAIENLDERSQDIIKSRWLTDEKRPTLQKIADKYGVSYERIRQVEAIALKKIKEELGDQLIDR